MLWVARGCWLWRCPAVVGVVGRSCVYRKCYIERKRTRTMDFEVTPGCGEAGCPGEAAFQSIINMGAAYSLIGGLFALVIAFGWYAWAKWDAQGQGVSKATKLMIASLVTAGGVAIAADLYTAVFNAASA